MRKAVAITALLGTAAILVACNNNDGRGPVDVAEDKVAAGVGQLSANAWAATNAETYLVAASTGDLYEVRSADIALQHSKSDAVKELARMIKADHTDASEKLKTAAGAEGLSNISSDLDERRQGMLDNLQEAANGDFDKAYLEQQIAAHEEAIALHNSFAGKADEAQLSAHARAVLPKIQAHLDKARELLTAHTQSN